MLWLMLALLGCRQISNNVTCLDTRGDISPGVCTLERFECNDGIDRAVVCGDSPEDDNCECFENGERIGTFRDTQQELCASLEAQDLDRMLLFGEDACGWAFQEDSETDPDF